ncbi:MAG TPA: hypothetical protein DCS23_00245 [Candidatus Yonathbacteria bacterium]|nr:hypothetical protein [Candidatus Yonathbacteria bacterium]
MRTDKDQAINLRKLGKSYEEISSKLRVPKSTLSAWFSSSGWSQKIKEDLNIIARKNNTVRIEDLNKIRGKHLERLYYQARQEALEEFNILKYHPTFVAGVMLYWGEGDKLSPHRVSLTNTDPAMIKIFMAFLKEVCGIREMKIKAWLLLYPDLQEADCKKYWVKEAGLQKITFNKSIYIDGRHKTKRLGHGVCTVGVSSRYFKEKMLLWISLFPDMLSDRELCGGNADII